MDIKNTKYLVKAAVIAAIYFVLTVILGDVGYGPVQFRVSEALTILPLFEPAAIFGLYIGCMIANIMGGYGLIDIVFGSLVTLIAAFITSKMPNKYLAALPPIILNAFIVSIWVSKMSGAPYLAVVGSIGFGEFLAVGVIGVILATVFERVTKNYK